MAKYNYISDRGKAFKSAMACALDNETNDVKFRRLFIFMDKEYPEAFLEWIDSRNFRGYSLQDVVRDLRSIDILWD